MDGQTNVWMDRKTEPHIEMDRQTLIIEKKMSNMQHLHSKKLID